MIYPKIIIQTCDSYRNILEANKYAMDKYGCKDMDVTVLGYSLPDFDLGNWKFFSMGKDNGQQHFTNDMSKFFDTFDDEYFIYVNDDIALLRPFNFNLFDKIFDTIKTIPNFGRVWLGEQIPNYYGKHTVVKDFNNNQLIEISQKSQYRLSLNFSLWKTEYFKKYLNPNLTPSQYENQDISKNDGSSILLTTNDYVVIFCHMFSGMKLIPMWYKAMFGSSELNDEDKSYINNILIKYDFYNLK